MSRAIFYYFQTLENSGIKNITRLRENITKRLTSKIAKDVLMKKESLNVLASKSAMILVSRRRKGFLLYRV